MVTLIEIGNYLYTLDNVQERDNAGFNRVDSDHWTDVVGRNDVGELRYTLHKYRKQLSNVFGTNVVEALGLNDSIESYVPRILAKSIVPHEVELFPTCGACRGESFNSYVRVCKQHGLRYKTDSQRWYVSARILLTINAEQFTSDIKDATLIELVGFCSVVAVAKTYIEANLDKVAINHKPTINKHVLSISRDSSGKFAVAFSYDHALVAFFSNNGGGLSGITAYNPETKTRETYSIELVEEIIEKVSKQFPAYEIQLQGILESIEEKNNKNSDLQKSIPAVEVYLSKEYKLFPYQNEMVHFLNKTDGKAIIGDEMGLGKTLQSLAWAVANNKSVLVVCPKVMRRTWIQEAAKFFPEYFAMGIELTPKLLKLNKDIQKYKIVSVNYESVQKWLKPIIDAKFDLLIIDESHRMKNPNAKITEILTALGQVFKHKILMSGTAIKNKKKELFSQLRMVAPAIYPTPASLNAATIGGAWNAIQSVYLARQKRDVLKDLPEKLTSIVKNDIEGLPDLPDSFEIGDIARVKHAIAKAKTVSTCEFIDEILSGSDEKVLVFTDSVVAAEAIAAWFGDLALLHHVQLGDDRREWVKSRFQEPASPERVFVTTTASCGVGATLTAASAVVFNDLPWTAADVRQAEDRAHRVGQKKCVNVYWMVAENSEFDNAVASLVMKKYKLSKMLNEGKQLSAADREWMDNPVNMLEILKSLKKAS